MKHPGRLVREVLIQMDVVSEAQLEAALNALRETGRPVVQTLIEAGALTSPHITVALAPQCGLVPGQTEPPSAELAGVLSVDFARLHRVAPQTRRGEQVVLATDQPLNLLATDFFAETVGEPVEWVWVPPEEMSPLLESLSTTSSGTGTPAASGSGHSIAPPIELPVLSAEEEELAAQGEDAPVIRLVTLLIQQASRQRASDIHIEPLADEVRVRYRIDGVLHQVPGPPKRLQGAIISRLKLMAGMDIAEKRLPQDGRMKVQANGTDLDLRAATLPALYGESLVLRLLDKSSFLLGMQELGFDDEQAEAFDKMITLPNGIVLVTGPTGSGKTTTLYAALNAINGPEHKLITVEDPVEYQLEGINQVQVHPQIGLTFAGGLRSMLRQAPDVIMVGEIRDHETAAIAIQAALTGHLIFSTLHTNDASGAVTRLVDMGMKPYLVASTLQAVLAQRLVRKVCDACHEPYPALAEELAALEGIAPDGDVTLQRGTGCDACGGTGFRGRIAIYELLQLQSSLRDMVHQCAKETDLRKAARAEGMRTLREDGLRKVLAGHTTVAEVLRATQEA